MRKFRWEIPSWRYVATIPGVGFWRGKVGEEGENTWPPLRVAYIYYTWILDVLVKATGRKFCWIVKIRRVFDVEYFLGGVVGAYIWLCRGGRFDRYFAGVLIANVSSENDEQGFQSA